MTKLWKRLFAEDECLQHDPGYEGIRGWWREQFGDTLPFYAIWEAAASTEVDDLGDSSERTIHIQGRVLKVWHSPDGFSVYEQS